MPAVERGRGSGVLAGAALVVLLALLLYVAAGPLTTNDLWWHLRHGEAFATQGFWPAADPCLHTAENPPTPHQWLFAVTAYGVEQGLGLHGLRILHAVLLLGVVGLAGSGFRRTGTGAPAVLLATAVFLVLSWYRVVQLRPELLSIAAALALWQLLFEPETVPSWRRVAAAVAVVAVWANVHTVFMVGPLLMLAALAGVAVQAGLSRFVLKEAVPEAVGLRGKRIAVALVLSLAAALANPRGIDQHLAFVVASRQGAIFIVLDEWARFDPFAWTNYAPAVSALAWCLADLLLLGFVAGAGWAVIGFFRAASAGRLARLDPVGLALGAAGLVALVTSIRFFWLSFLPLVYLLRLGRDGFERRSAGWLAAAATVGLAFAYPLWGGWNSVATLMPRDPARWLAQPYTAERFFETGIRFLDETGVEGNLFNTHEMGGFLCYRLSPRLRTFLDGSMNFSSDVWRDLRRVNAQHGAWPFESYLDVLDRRNVDLFFGVGVPAPGAGQPGEGVYTTALLERAPGWILVSRGMRHGIYLRANERNRENLRRIEAWYAERGVPFDPERGLEPGVVIAAAPDFAAEHQLVPPRWGALLAARDAARATGEPERFEPVGLIYALSGAYGEQLENDLEAVRLAPEAKAPRRRLVWALLRLDRPQEALRAAKQLLALDREDPRSGFFARAAAIYARAVAVRFPSPNASDPVPPASVINQLPLLSARSPLRQ